MLRDCWTQDDEETIRLRVLSLQLMLDRTLAYVPVKLSSGLERLSGPPSSLSNLCSVISQVNVPNERSSCSHNILKLNCEIACRKPRQHKFMCKIHIHWTTRIRDENRQFTLWKRRIRKIPL